MYSHLVMKSFISEETYIITKNKLRKDSILNDFLLDFIDSTLYYSYNLFLKTLSYDFNSMP
jgi:hypothetical protein